MPFIQEVSLEIVLIVFCINGMIYVGHTEIPNYSIVTPFNIGSNVTATAQPQALNYTNPNNVLVNETNPNNSTSFGTIVQTLFSNVFAFIQYVYVFVLFITGGFIWSALGMFGFPASFVYILQGVMVFFLARTVLYYVKGV